MVNMVVYIESNKTSVHTSNSTLRMVALQAGMKPITFCLTPTFMSSILLCTEAINSQLGRILFIQSLSAFRLHRLSWNYVRIKILFDSEY